MRNKTFILVLAALSLHFFITCVEGETHGMGKFRFTFPFGKRYDYDNILVTRVVDGDTVELENREKVRLIGIDTPESDYNPKLERDAKRTHRDYGAIIAMGKIAAGFTKNLAEGKKVRLEFDIEKRDQYGRLLAYVYLSDGRMLNAEIIKKGYAQVYTFPPNVRHAELFLRLQKEARENKRGFWGE
ncbi:MAG: hypothetical protein A2Z72_04125 [Omnitrophica bacterium RBG_13_46_9]|nr:MAG: hypothetical protein A2Z72_04125 [Omnitrophica bacterium RBG_13_46_9]